MLSKTHLLNNSLALSSSLRTKGSNRSYLASLGMVFKLVCTPLAIHYGTKPTLLQYSATLQYPGTTAATVTRKSAHWPGPTGPRVGCYNHPPLRIRRPHRVPDQPKYQDLLSWSHPIHLVLMVPCATSVRLVPTVPVRRPCLARTRPHAGGNCAPTRPCSCPRTSARMWRETARVRSDTTVTTRPGRTAKIYSSR